jgi:hypothetical protein
VRSFVTADLISDHLSAQLPIPFETKRIRTRAPVLNQPHILFGNERDAAALESNLAARPKNNVLNTERLLVHWRIVTSAQPAPLLGEHKELWGNHVMIPQVGQLAASSEGVRN